MDIAVLLAQQIAQLFLIMLMGYAVVKSGLLKSADSKCISVILVYLVTPCVIIHSFQIDYTPQIRDGLLLALLSAILIHVLMLLLTELLRRPLHLDVIERANIIYSNAGILVIPLVTALLGSEYVIYSSAFIAVQLVLLWTHCKGMLCSDGFDLKKILLNLNILSIIAGILLFLFQIKLPGFIDGTLSMMSSTIGPIGMLLAGMVIADVPLRTVFCTPRSYLPTAFRLILYPFIILLLMKLSGAAYLIPEGKNILLISFLAAMTPACATVTSMAQLYDADAPHASALYVLTTLLSIATMPFMIGLFEYFI